MDGVEATKLIRAKGWNKQSLPIVGLTASYQKAQSTFYTNIGMNVCIAKPVQLEVLNHEILTHTTRNPTTMKAVTKLTADGTCEVTTQLGHEQPIAGLEPTIRMS